MDILFLSWYDSELTNVKDARLFYFMLKSIIDIENVGLCVYVLPLHHENHF